jgi:hypothetical protein
MGRPPFHALTLSLARRPLPCRSAATARQRAVGPRRLLGVSLVQGKETWSVPYSSSATGGRAEALVGRFIGSGKRNVVCPLFFFLFLWRINRGLSPFSSCPRFPHVFLTHLVGRKRNLSSLTVVFDRGLVFRQSELEPIDLPENWVWEAH